MLKRLQLWKDGFSKVCLHRLDIALAFVSRTSTDGAAKKTDTQLSSSPSIHWHNSCRFSLELAAKYSQTVLSWWETNSQYVYRGEQIILRVFVLLLIGSGKHYQPVSQQQWVWITGLLTTTANVHNRSLNSNGAICGGQQHPHKVSGKVSQF